MMRQRVDSHVCEVWGGLGYGCVEVAQSVGEWANKWRNLCSNHAEIYGRCSCVLEEVQGALKAPPRCPWGGAVFVTQGWVRRRAAESSRALEQLQMSCLEEEGVDQGCSSREQRVWLTCGGVLHNYNITNTVWSISNISFLALVAQREPQLRLSLFLSCLYLFSPRWNVSFALDRTYMLLRPIFCSRNFQCWE